MRFFIAVVLFALLLDSPTQAAFKTGNDLLANCKSDISFAQGECLGYVLAVADSIDGPLQFSAKLKTGTALRPRACIRYEVTAGQLQDIVVKWLADNPQWRDISADGAVATALTQAFPC